MPSPTPPGSGHARGLRPIAVVAAGFIIQMVMWGGFYTFGVFLIPLSEELSQTRGDVTLAYSVTSIVFGVGSVLAGTMVDRWGAKRVIAICCTVGMAGYCLLAVATSGWQVFVGLGLLTGIGLTGSYVPVTSTVARWFDAKRGTALGVVIAGNAVGGLAGPVLSSRAVEIWGWRSAYFFIAGAVLVATLVCVSLIDDPGHAAVLSKDPGAGPVDVDSDGPGHPPARAGSTRFLLLSCIWVVHGVLGAAFLAHYLPHMLDVGIPGDEGAVIFGVVGALGVLGGGFAGVLGDRFGSRRSLIVALLLLVAVPATLLGSVQPIAFWVISILFGLSWFGIGVLVPLIATELVAPVALGKALGLLELVWALGAAVGSAMLAWTFDLSASYRAGWMILLGGAVLGLGIAVVLQALRGGGHAERSITVDESRREGISR